MSRRKQLRPFKVQDDDDCNANHTNGLDNCLSIPSNGDHAEVLTSNQELDGVAGVDGVVYNLKSKNDDESICNEMGPSIDENGEGKKDQKLHVENGQIDKPTIADGSENNPPENVTLDALENAKAAVAQFAAAALAKGADGSSAKDLTMIQSALFTLQHQQVFQMQLIEQLQFQLAKSNTRKDNKKSTESKTKQDDGENEENQTDTVIADNFPSNQIKCDDDEIKTIVQKEPKSNDESKDDEKLIASDDPTDSNISATLASDIITNHDSDLRSDEPNSLQLLQKRAEEVLDSASQSFTTGSLIDELSYRTGAFFNDGPSDDPSMKHRCRFCGKIFGSDSALQIHLRSHTGERPFVCRVCGSRFTTKGNLKVHYQRHTETMNYAEEVKKDVIPPYDFRAQTKQHTSKHADKTPSESPFDLTNKSDKEDNYFNNSNETHDSDSESPKFDDDGGVRNILNFDQEYSSSKKEAWEKFMEIVDTPKATELQQDEAYRVDPNKCPICNRLLSCRSALRQHYRTHTGERPFRCRLCARSFTTKGNLKTHIGVHKINPLLSPVHSCTLCHKKYSTAHALQQHINTHTGAPIEMTIDQIRAAEVREFVSRDSLSELYGSNSSLGDCNETSTRDSDFDAAPKSLDADTRNMSKVDLSDSEDSRSRLKRTPQNVEKEIDKMRTNFNYSTSPEPKRHCNESEKVPRNDSTARMDFFSKFSPIFGSASVPLSSPSHILGANLNPLLAANSFNPVVFSSGVRGNTTCNICFKTLACQSALEIHYRSHTKEKPYVCQLCNRGFSTKGNMKQHMLTHKIRDMPQHVFRNSTQSPSSDSNNSLSATGYQTQTSTDAPAELTHDDTHADRIVRQLKTKDEFDKNANAATVDQSDAMYLSSDDSGSMSLAVRPKNGLTNFNEINDDSDKMKNADVRPTTTPTDDSHAERNNKTSRKLPSKSNRDYCRICCKHFGSFSALDTHMRSHTGAKPFLCTICDKSFSTKGNLKVHVAAHSWTNDANRSNHRNPLDMPSFPQLNPYGLQRPADLFNPFIANAAALQQKLHEANLYQKYVNAANMREFAGDAKHNDELLHRNLFGLAHLPFQMFNDHIDPSMKNK